MGIERVDRFRGGGLGWVVAKVKVPAVPERQTFMGSGRGYIHVDLTVNTSNVTKMNGDEGTIESLLRLQVSATLSEGWGLETEGLGESGPPKLYWRSLNIYTDTIHIANGLYTHQTK